MWKSFKKLDSVMEREDYVRFLFLLVPISLTALLSVCSIFSIFPFMKVASNPETFDSNVYFQWMKSVLNIESPREMLNWLGAIVITIYGLSAIANVVSGWLITKVVWQLAHRVSTKLLDRYTRQPYSYFLTHNSNDMVKKAIADINSLISGIVKVAVQLVMNIVKSASILTLLMFIDFKLASLAILLYGGIYALIQAYRHQYLLKLGQVRIAMITSRLKTFTETLSGIKTLRISGALERFNARFEKASKTFCDINPVYQLYVLIPKHFVEFSAFGGTIFFVLYQLNSGGQLADLIPKISVFAMATFKLLPAIGQGFAQIANINHNLPVLDEIEQDMKMLDGLLPSHESFASAEKLKFEDRIELNEVTFHYESSGMPVLNQIELEIPKGLKCAFVGSTGCGKSTLVDVLVGLLAPSSGSVKVDGQPINNDNVYGWQKQIAYVPQDIFLFDDTIAANITLGEPAEVIVRNRMERAARLAQVEEFVNSEFREGYETMVGEKGIRLSGGQRQRIGLARAFYQRPELIVLDEATSALDTITEEAVITALQNEFPELTVVMIAHRLASTRFCDVIFLVDNGVIVDSGSYDQLMVSSLKFRQMVEVKSAEG